MKRMRSEFVGQLRVCDVTVDCDNLRLVIYVICNNLCRHDL